MTNQIWIAIDGPAGSGKSSIAKTLVNYLPNFIHINTGAFYRAIAYYFFVNKINYKNEILRTNNLEKIQLDLNSNNEIIIESLNNLNVNNFIHNEEIAKVASEIAVYPDVRTKINNILKQIIINKNIIMDGRDIGTVVLPNADLKIFIDADTKTRALRRLKDEKLDESHLEEIIKIIEQRDYNDYNRPIGALKVAENAIVIKNDNLSIDDCCKLIVQHLKNVKELN